MTEQVLTAMLNESQKKALTGRFDVERSIRGIWGPPGTGKTFVAAIEATKALIEYHQRILICAYQNSTVDNTLRFIIKQLVEHGWDPKMIEQTIKRTGNISRISDDIRPYFSRNSSELATAKIVGTTLHSSFSPLPRRLLQPDTFNRIIMDESGQITPEQSWIPLPLLTNGPDATITIYGDDVQLSPISPDLVPEKGVLRSLRTANNSSVDMLNTTYRLNSPGIEMTSETFYFGNLHAPTDVKNRRLSMNKTSDGYLREAISPDNPLAYIGVDCIEEPDGLSFDNYQQAMVISDLCQEFIRCGINPSQICVMAAYRAHVRSISAALEGTGIECSTVHRMLGGENDIIVLASTRSNASRDLGFISQPELLNVATSRQLRKLVIVGDNRETFSEGCKVSKKIYDFINKHGTYIRLE